MAVALLATELGGGRALGWGLLVGCCALSCLGFVLLEGGSVGGLGPSGVHLASPIASRMGSLDCDVDQHDRGHIEDLPTSRRFF